MKATILFHSVCGNTYLMAKKFNQCLIDNGQNSELLRIQDDDWTTKDDWSDKTKEVMNEMSQEPQASPDLMLDSDLIIMGSPTYFGNVSGEMKTFMDSTAGHWIQAKLFGKKFAAFASAGNTEGGASFCLHALQTYAIYMGMLIVPVPTTLIPKTNVAAHGLIQYSNASYAEVLDDTTSLSIEKYTDVLIEQSK